MPEAQNTTTMPSVEAPVEVPNSRIVTEVQTNNNMPAPQVVGELVEDHFDDPTASTSEKMDMFANGHPPIPGEEGFIEGSFRDVKEGESTPPVSISSKEPDIVNVKKSDIKDNGLRAVPHRANEVVYDQQGNAIITGEVRELDENAPVDANEITIVTQARKQLDEDQQTAAAAKIQEDEKKKKEEQLKAELDNRKQFIIDSLAFKVRKVAKERGISLDSNRVSQVVNQKLASLSERGNFTEGEIQAAIADAEQTLMHDLSQTTTSQQPVQEEAA